MPYGEVEMAEKAKAFKIDYEGKKVQVYQWGEGKPILFVHGWMGRGTQFRKFIEAFNESGYQVISFDATGHGKSDGSRSHLMEFAGVIKILHSKYEGFEMIVGHSLGGVASMIAINDGIPTNKLIMISSPTLAHKIVDEFIIRLKASNKCKDYFDGYVIRKFGKRFEEYSATHIAQELREIDLLLIYDEDDREVDLENPRALLNVYPNARLVTTSGLGHTRILKDEEVVKTCLQFLKQSELEPAT